MATKLDLADAQFIGYANGKDRDLIAMVKAMALTKKEWANWKATYPTYPLTEREVEEINEHFE